MEEFCLIQECTNKYYINEINDNELEIYIRIPKKYKYLWLEKLSGLYTTEDEIQQLQDEV